MRPFLARRRIGRDDDLDGSRVQDNQLGPQLEGQKPRAWVTRVVWSSAEVVSLVVLVCHILLVQAQVKETIDATLNRISSSGVKGASYFTGGGDRVAGQNELFAPSGHFLGGLR